MAQDYSPPNIEKRGKQSEKEIIRQNTQVYTGCISAVNWPYDKAGSVGR